MNSPQQNTIRLSLKGRKKVQRQFQGQDSVIDGFLQLTQKEYGIDNSNVSNVNNMCFHNPIQHNNYAQSKPISYTNQTHNYVSNNNRISQNFSSNNNQNNIQKESQNFNPNYSFLQQQYKYCPSPIIKSQRIKTEQASQIPNNLTKNNSSKNVSFKLFPSYSNTKIPSSSNLRFNTDGNQIVSNGSIGENIKNQQQNKKRFDSQLFRSAIVANQNNGLSNQYYYQGQNNNLTNSLHHSSSSGKTPKLKKYLSYSPYQSKTSSQGYYTKSALQQNSDKFIDKDYSSSLPSGSKFMEKPVFKTNIFIQNQKETEPVPQRAFLKQKNHVFNQGNPLSFSYHDNNNEMRSSLSNSNMSKIMKLNLSPKQGLRSTVGQTTTKIQLKYRPPLPMKEGINAHRQSGVSNLQKNHQVQFSNIQKKLRATIGITEIHSPQFKGQPLRWARINSPAKQNSRRSSQQKSSGQNSLKKISKSFKVRSQSADQLPLLNKFTLLNQKSHKTPVNILSISNFELGLPKAEGKTEFNQQTFIAKQMQTGMLVAIKKFKKKNVQSKLNHFILELKIQMMIDQENIVKTYGIFSDEQHIYLIQQYIEEGSLYALMKMKKSFNQNEVAQKSLQIAKGINALHEHSIIHRKIKPESIVLTHGVCKIDDFSLATACINRRQTYIGSFGYTSPQMKSGDSYDQSNDVWCLGIIIYEMLNGKPPFYHLKRKQSKKKFSNTSITYGEKFSNESQNLLQKMLKQSPQERITIDEVLMQSFFSINSVQRNYELQRQFLWLK